MHILMLTEYFYPFDRGGSEWSTYYLAQAIIKQGHTVSIFTPNYGTKSKESWENLNTYRFWFPVKFKKGEGKSVSPIWFTNILWYTINFFQLLSFVHRYDIDILHVQGKYFLPQTYLVGKLRRIPIILSVRDYLILCSYGICISKSRRYKKCSFPEFVWKEIPQYFNTLETKKHILGKFFLSVFGLHGRLVSSFLLFFAKKITVVAISQKMQKILTANGIRSTVIYNLMEFTQSKLKKEKLILFIGRLTWGKGADLVIPAVQSILKESEYRLIFIGEGILKNTIIKQIDAFKINNKVSLLGHLPYRDSLGYIRHASLIIIPSRWEEPFGRVALEGLASGTSVVASNRGALPEIINNSHSGFVVEPEIDELRKACERAITKNNNLGKNIKTSYFQLKQKFYYQPTQDYLNLYKKLIRK